MALRLKTLGLFLTAAFLVLFFQNCSNSSSLQFSNLESASKSEDGTGAHPYDGKLYCVFGEVCSDGTALQSRIAFAVTGEAQLIRQNCQDITPVVLSPSQYSIDSNTSNLTYNGQTFVATAPEAVGAGYGVLPKLSAPVDPSKYGAVGDGVTDNTSAFTTALNAGDLLIPDGKYVIKGTIRVPAGRNIQCKSLSTVTIVNPNVTTSGTHTFQFWSNGGSISNCHLAGASSLNSNGSSVFDVNFQYNYLVSIVDYFGATSNITVTNNVFENCHGNACLTVYGSSGYGTTNSNIVNNTFKNCGYHSVVINGGSRINFASNHSTDCSMGLQSDPASKLPTLANILEYNYLTVIHGNGNNFTSGGSVYLTGGTNNVDYSTNVVRYNTVVGNGQPYSIEILMKSLIPAIYLNNTCINGCVLQ